VFGFGKKQIDIALEKYNFSPGETVKGKVFLTLDKSVHAKQLKVALIGEQISTTMQRMPNGTMNRTQEKTYVYNFQMPLDGEKDYQQGEYTFEIKIPANVLQNIPLEGKIGGILKTIQALSMAGARISWYVQANLDIPMRLDILKKVQINIA
jgi:sporulation-control protein spo0M